MDFSTDDWSFDLGGSAPEQPALATDKTILPWIASPEAWAQYTDDRLYEVDSLVRSWIEAMSKNGLWVRSAKKRRYTMSMVFEQIYGRKYDCKTDSKMVSPMTKVLSYYSSKIQKCGSIDGKTYTKNIYTISPKRLKTRLPYSLKLRTEYLAEIGEVPNYYNMRLPKDNLEPGHARNPRTDANMERRSREAKDRYNERYKDRNRKTGI